LGDLKLDGPTAGSQGFGFEAIGVAEPSIGAFNLMSAIGIVVKAFQSE
jgi:hypothetical protein